MSTSVEVANQLADWLRSSGFDQSYGVMVTPVEKKGRMVQHVNFAKAAILDASVDVYSSTFLLLKWQTSIRDLPRNGQEVFKDISSLQMFIKENM